MSVWLTASVMLPVLLQLPLLSWLVDTNMGTWKVPKLETGTGVRPCRLC